MMNKKLNEKLISLGLYYGDIISQTNYSKGCFVVNNFIPTTDLEIFNDFNFLKVVEGVKDKDTNFIMIYDNENIDTTKFLYIELLSKNNVIVNKTIL